MSFMIALAAGIVTGVLSGWGVCGGTLLMIFMTSIAGISQAEAQGINLFYFLPTSATALYFHIKNRLLERDTAIPAIIAGVVTTLVSALAATAIDTSLLKKIFGVFLITVGVFELFKKSSKK